MSVESIKQGIPQQYFHQQVAAASNSKNDLTSTKQDDISASKSAASLNSRQVDQVILNTDSPLKNLDTARAIEQMHARLNELAKGVRETNEALAATSKLLDQAQTPLSMIIKNYPPFTADSKERQNLLMSYISIRKEIEQMTVPPPPPPIYEKITYMWDNLFSEGRLKTGIIPEINTMSSDQSLKEASSAIATGNELIASVSTGITNALLMR